MIHLCTVVILGRQEKDRDHRSAQFRLQGPRQGDGGGRLVGDEERAPTEDGLLPGQDDDGVGRDRVLIVSTDGARPI
jgi:hypothetical protein